MSNPEAQQTAAIEAADRAFAADPPPRVSNTSPLRNPQALTPRSAPHPQGVTRYFSPVFIWR